MDSPISLSSSVTNSCMLVAFLYAVIRCLLVVIRFSWWQLFCNCCRFSVSWWCVGINKDVGSAGSLQGPVGITGGLGTYITVCLGEGICRSLPLKEWGRGPTGPPSTTNGHMNTEMGTSYQDRLRPFPAPGTWANERGIVC